MRIALDAMGGDLAPAEPVRGAVLASKELGIEVALVGPADVLQAELRKHGAAPGVTVVPAASTIDMDEDDVVDAVRRRRDASINVAMSMVREGSADAVVSAGNTGAVGTSGCTRTRLKGCAASSVPSRWPMSSRTCCGKCDASGKPPPATACAVRASPPGARPMPRSMRPGYKASSMRNASATRKAL